MTNNLRRKVAALVFFHVFVNYLALIVYGRHFFQNIFKAVRFGIDIKSADFQRRNLLLIV